MTRRGWSSSLVWFGLDWGVYLRGFVWADVAGIFFGAGFIFFPRTVEIGHVANSFDVSCLYTWLDFGRLCCRCEALTLSDPGYFTQAQVLVKLRMPRTDFLFLRLESGLVARVAMFVCLFVGNNEF